MALNARQLLDIARADPINAELIQRLPALGLNQCALVAGTGIGLELETDGVYAPYGLSDVEQSILRINPLNAEPELFALKARSYQARWPWLRIEA